MFLKISCLIALALYPCSFLLSAADKNAEKPFRQMDYGPSLNWTYQVADDHIVYKGIAVQVDDAAGGIGKASGGISGRRFRH